MLITLTAKLKLKDITDVIANEFEETFANYINALNYVSVKANGNEELMFSYVKLHNEVYYDIRKRYNLFSQTACSVSRTVCARYKTLRTNGQLVKKSGKPNIPTFKKKDLDLVYNKDYTIDPFNGIIRISTNNGKITVPFYTKGNERYLDGTWQFGQAKLKHYRNNYFLFVSDSKELTEAHEPNINSYLIENFGIDINGNEIESLTNEQYFIKTNTDCNFSNVIGIDVGLNFIATIYDGKKTLFFNGKQIKNKRAHYKCLRRQLQIKNTKSSKRRLKALEARENRYVNNINHCITKALVLDYPNSLFVVEDLSNVRDALAKVKHKDRYYMVSWPYADFFNKLEYKASLNGSKLIKTNPRNTSRRCPKCMYIDKLNRDRKTHSFHCLKCGYNSNDDRVGAMNLYINGKKLLD